MSEIAKPHHVLSRADFIKLVDWTLQTVLNDDSAEGSLSWRWGDEPGTYVVEGAIRFGNRDGQGSVRLLGSD